MIFLAKVEWKGIMKKKNNKNVIIYGLCGILVAFYLVILYLGMNPNVDIEYRMYYITNELSDWPGYGRLHYDLGTWEYCTHTFDEYGQYVTYTVANRKGSGWKKDSVQNNGSCNDEDVANMYYIPNSSKDNAIFNINITQYQGDKKTYVYAGDDCIGEFQGEGTHSFTIPKVVADEMLIIRFETEGDRFTLWQAMIG